MYSSLVLGFNLTRFLLGLEIESNGPFNWVFLCAYFLKLILANVVLEVARFLFVFEGLSNRVIHPVFEVHVQLVLESISPVIFVSQVLHTGFEIH
jgi:hypothetical protein